MKKRILALLTTASLLLNTAALPTQATQSTRSVEMSDVLDILKSLVGLKSPLSLDYDFNENGVIDVGDALEGLKSLIIIPFKNLLLWLLIRKSSSYFPSD